MTSIEKRKSKELLIGHLRKTPIIQIACEKAEISRMTFYRWKKDDQEFSKAADEAMQEGCLMVNDLAESQLISAIKDRNLQAVTYWLRFHHPSYKQSFLQEGFVLGRDDEQNLYFEFFGQLKPENQKMVESKLKELDSKNYGQEKNRPEG